MVKITLYIGHVDDTARPLEIARMADRAGLYGIAVGEHVALGSDLSNYPYEGGLAHGDAGRKPYLEPAVLGGAIAAATNQIRISNCVMLAPLRPAVLLAKQLTTIDIISGGRCEPCFGMGWSRDEYMPRSMPTMASAGRSCATTSLRAARSERTCRRASIPRPWRSTGCIRCRSRSRNAFRSCWGSRRTRRMPRSSPSYATAGSAVPTTATRSENCAREARIFHEAFARAERNPDDLVVRAHLPRYMTADGASFDLERIFADVPAMREAGVTEFATGVTGPPAGPFGSMEAIERHIAKVAELAAKY